MSTSKLNNFKHWRMEQKNWKNKSVRLLLEQDSEFEKNPVEIIKSKARKLVLDAYNLGWQGPPFDIIELAQLLNISVTPNETVRDARIVPTVSDTLEIQYNPYQRKSRMNFSVAHEIGHTLFPDCADEIRNREENTSHENWELEFLCNLAASEILLPYGMFSNDVKQLDLDLDSLKSLSNRYNSSLEATAIRFCEVTNEPCQLIIAKYDENYESLRVSYSIQSNAAKGVLPSIESGYIIPICSKAYECSKPGWTASGVEKWGTWDHSLLLQTIGLSADKGEINQKVGILITPKNEIGDRQEIIKVVGDATVPRGNGKKIIVQIVNSSGATGAGFGKAMSKAYPKTKKYLNAWKDKPLEFKFGGTQTINIEEDLFVFQILAQKGIFSRNGEIPLKYDYLHVGLQSLFNFANEIGASIHMPYIGAGQAGGNWDIIEGMILHELVNKGLKVVVYELAGKPLSKKKSELPSLFDVLT